MYIRGSHINISSGLYIDYIAYFNRYIIHRYSITGININCNLSSRVVIGYHIIS